MTTLQIRIDAQTKKKAKETLANLGLDISSGIKLFLEQVINTQSVPFIPTTTQGLKLHNWQQQTPGSFCKYCEKLKNPSLTLPLKKEVN